MDELATRIAERLIREFSIGHFSQFFDDPPDFDRATADEIAEVIKQELNTQSK